MAKRTKNPTSVVTFVLMVAFGLIALVAAYKTIKGGSFDTRGKAASGEVMVKQWTFDNNKGGWKFSSVSSVGIENGSLVLAIEKDASLNPDPTPRMEIGGLGAVLSHPSTFLRLKVSVNPGVSMRPRGTTTIPVNVMYKTATMKELESFSGETIVADGTTQTFDLRLPDSSFGKKLSRIALSFPGLEKWPGTKILVDEISLYAKQATPSTSPSSCPGPNGTACKTAVCPQPTCASGQPCPRIGCKVQPGVCVNKVCVPQGANPSPPQGCFYKDVKCIQAPCDPILVCPTSSPKTTPITACTRDLHICPDGTRVGRTGPNCEFVCPKPPGTSSSCVRSGCSGQLCVAKGDERVTTCEYKEEYACYATATCEVQQDGTCGWTPTSQLTACLASASKSGN